jgi:DNA-binding IclR family transcriptional regulator
MPVRSGTDQTPPGSAPAVVRAIAVLDALAESPTGFLSLSDLARELGIPKSSASTICNALEAGMLIRRGDIGYRLGRRTVELGGAYLSRMDQLAEFYDHCTSSVLFSAETVRLSVLAGTDTLCLARYEGRPALRLTSGIGDKFPANASAQGKALLAQLDDSEVERIFHGIGELPQATHRSIRTVPELLADLGRTRRRGYGLDECEAADHVVGLAVAIPTRGVRSPMLAVSVTMLDSQVTDERRERAVSELRRIATALGNPMARVQQTA